METLKEILRSVVEGIGYKAARAEQRRVILSFVQGKDIFVSLPRGSGKCLGFYALPLFYDKLRNNSEPKSVVVVLLEFIVVYANRALQAHLTADQ